MKRILVAIVVTLVAAGAIGQQKSQGMKYADSRLIFRETMAAGSQIVSYIEANDLELVKIEMDLVGLSNPKQTLKQMSPNFTYLISATGTESRIADLDIEVIYIGKDGETYPISKDEETDNSPTVTFTPPVAGTYMVLIRAATMRKGMEASMGFYFLAIAHN